MLGSAEREQMNKRTLTILLFAVLGAVVVIYVAGTLRKVDIMEEARTTNVQGPNDLKLSSSLTVSRYMDWPLPDLELGIELPRMPEKVMVYRRVVPDEMTESDARRLSHEYFDMPLGAELMRSKSGNYIRVKTATHLFELDARRGWFNNVNQAYRSTTHSNRRQDYPSDDECVRIAASYLTDRGLLPDDSRLGGVVDNSSAGCISVGFGQVIGGHGCWGSGGRVSVHVGIGGEIVSVWKQWLEVEPFREYPIKTVSEALEEARKGHGWFLTVGGGTIRKIELRYETGTFLRPVYYFDYSADEEFRYVVVPAIRQDFLMSAEEMQEAAQRAAAQRQEEQAEAMRKAAEGFISKERAIELARDVIEGELKRREDFEYDPECEVVVEIQGSQYVVTFIDEAAKKEEEARFRYAARVWLDGKTGEFVKVLSPRL